MKAFASFWSQDPYNWYVVLVLETHSKILLENSLNWKLSKLKVAKTEGCQNWRLPKMKVAKIARIVKIENCQVVKLPKLKVAKIKNWQSWKLLKIGNC